MKKVIFILLCSCMTSYCYPQSTFGQYLVPLSVEGGDSIGQSFHFTGGAMTKISFAVFSRYLTTDHPAILYIRSGNTPYGPIVHQSLILVPSLNKFYPDSLLDTASLNTMDGNFWMAIQNGISSGTISYSDLKTEYSVNENFPSGDYTAVIALDTGVRNPLAWDNFITGFTNCFSQSLCNATGIYGPLQSNVYADGQMYWGGTTFPLSVQIGPFFYDADLAFEVTYTSIGTQVNEVSTSNGKVLIPNDCNGCTLILTDMLGRTLSQTLLIGGEEVILPKNQLLCVSLVNKKGRIYSKKVFAIE